MSPYHYGYHDWPLTGEDCPVCAERREAEGEEAAIRAAEEMDAMERAAKEQARRRGWLTGDIHQTSRWFEDGGRRRPSA